MTQRATVLFRASLADGEQELEVCSQYLHTVQSRVEVRTNSLVVGRYSVLPYYRELERDLRLASRSGLINSWREHQYIADVLQWSGVFGALAGATPASWADWYHLPEGAYVVKGRTNSRKGNWLTHMYAPSKAALGHVVSRLLDDTFIREQGVVVREYVPLRELGPPGINGIPVTNEWRTFWCVAKGKAHLLASGFYWSSHPEAKQLASLPPEVLTGIAQKAADALVPHATFFVLDLAETADGRWIVVEVNDGQMSGLSEVDPHELYSNLARVLKDV